MDPEAEKARTEWENGAQVARDALRRLSEDSLSLHTADEGWTVRELAAHVATCDEYTVMTAKRLGQGKPAIPIPLPDALASRIGGLMNGRKVAAFRSATASDLSQRFEKEHAAAAATLDSIPAEGWSKPARVPLMGKVTLAEFITGMADHYREHATTLNEALVAKDAVAPADPPSATA